MPTKNAPKNATKTPFNNQFVNYDLTKEEQALCKAWNFDLEDYFSVMDKLLDAGYKVGFSNDNYNKCYAAFLTPTKDTKDNQGLILSGRGSSPFKAFKQLVYKHFHIFDEHWEEFVGARQFTIDD